VEIGSGGAHACIALGCMSHACYAVRGGVVVLGGTKAALKSGENELEDCFTAVARLPGGRVVCVGMNGQDAEGITAEVLEELPDQGSLTSAASWRWRELPGMSVARSGCGGCVLSDCRVAVFGGVTGPDVTTITASCEALSLGGDDERWEPLPPMHEARVGFACAAVGGCVIVASGNDGRGTVEVY
jgi:hypothetical protein